MIKLPSILAILPAFMIASGHASAEEHLGPAIYLAAEHEVGGRSVIHWKYNIAKPEISEVRIVDASGEEVAVVKRPLRQADVTGRSRPFRLIPLRADGKQAAEVLVPGAPSTGIPWWQSLAGATEGSADSPTSGHAVPPTSRIGIGQSGGKAEFVHLATGTVFRPMGMNYVPLRHGDHAAFEAKTTVADAFYDGLEAETVLRLLRDSGYNTVRVFVTGRRPENPGFSGERETVGLYVPYLDNLADFLRRASENGIYVILNFADVDLPQNKYFRDKVGGEKGTGLLFRETGVLAFREMVSSTLGYLKAKNPDLLKAILGVQFNNEVDAKLTQWPFTEKGPATTANGKTYDMSVPEDRLRCYEEGLAFYYEQLSAAVKGVDRDILTCEGVFVAAAVGRDHRLGAATFDPANLAKGFDWEKKAGLRVPPPITLLVKTPLDFIDIHLYPPGPLANFATEIEDLLASSLFKKAVALGAVSEKPVILGEFGAFKAFVERDTNDGLAGGWKRWSRARDLACTQFGFVGYLGWSLETFDQTDIFQALAFGPDFLRSFREEFASPPSEPLQPPDPGAVAELPILLKEVPPTGAGQGFLIP